MSRADISKPGHKDTVADLFTLIARKQVPNYLCAARHDSENVPAIIDRAGFESNLLAGMQKRRCQHHLIFVDFDGRGVYEGHLVNRVPELRREFRERRVIHVDSVREDVITMLILHSR